MHIADQPRKFTGHFLAKNRKSPKVRTRYAVDPLQQRAAIDRLTAKQIAAICRVSPSAVSEALNGSRLKRPLDLKRRAVIKAFQAATPDEQRDFVRACGIASMKIAVWRAHGN